MQARFNKQKTSKETSIVQVCLFFKKAYQGMPSKPIWSELLELCGILQ